MIKTLDKQLAGIPKEVIFCKKCVVSNQRPRIIFDGEGVCSACRYAEEKARSIDWKEREDMLRDLLDRHRSKDGSYDVIVPGSAGKDSAFVSYELKHRYNMHPLTVTWAPFLYTDIGWNNYVNFVQSGYDNILFYPNGRLHRKLARIAFETKGDALEPFIYGMKSYAFHIALKFGVPLIFYGENGEVEYCGVEKNKNKPFESVNDWEEMYFKGSGVDTLVKYGVDSGIFAKDEFTKRSFDMYKAPDLEKINKLGVQMHWYSFYHNWSPLENYKCALEYTGFKTNPDGRSEGTYTDYGGLDDKMDGFHWYLGYIKFGLGRASRDAQMEIRSGRITRKEGVAFVHKYDGEFPVKYFREFLEYLNITEDRFWEVVDRYRMPHLWERADGKWVLKHKVG